MKRAFAWIWSKGIVSTFLAGLFALLPIIITIAILRWVAGFITTMLAEDPTVGIALRSLRLDPVRDRATSLAVGLILVLLGIWLFGLVIKSTARNRVERALSGVINRIPVVKSVYSTVSQLVGMLKRDEEADLKGMSVVFCGFGQDRGPGFLGLLASPETYRFEDRSWRIVYVPTSPIPMSGYVVFVPAEMVKPVDMSVEQLMRIYFSMGILAPQVVPDEHQVLSPKT